MKETIGELYTSNWKVLGEDRIRRWTDDLNRTEQVKPQIEDPRPVSVRIHTWRGMSIGAKHFNLSIREHDNMWWSESEGSWVSIYNDTAASGFTLDAGCYTEQEAKEIAKAAVDIVFGKPRTKKRRMFRIDWEWR